MTEATLLAFDLPSVNRKKLTIDFDGGSQSSDGGLLLLREAERSLGICARLAESLTDRRDPTRISHSLVEMIKTRALAICCGYEDGIDLDRLRHDPLLKLAVGRCPESGAELCSQATMSRLENMPSRRQAARLTAALIDQFCASFPAPPTEITLDIDDTLDIVHGGQQLSFWNAHHDERCFMPIHVYHVESGKPVVVILRSGKTPAGKEVQTVIKHITRRIKRHWPATRITWRGDSHYGRVEAMAWCEENELRLHLRLPGQQRARCARGRGCRDHAAAPCGLLWRARQGPRLRRLRAQAQELGAGAPLHRPHRGLVSGDDIGPPHAGDRSALLRHLA